MMMMTASLRFLMIFQWCCFSFVAIVSGFCPFQLPLLKGRRLVAKPNVLPPLLPTTMMKTHCLPTDNAENDHTENENEEEDDDDDNIIKPYGNRSLAWTKRYRRLNPYEKVRDRVIRHFGHRSKSDWDECVANGWQGQYVPSRPQEMYAPEWTSWDDFLGVMRDYNDCRNVAVNVLGLRSLDEYIIFVRSNPQRAQGLRIPVRPDLLYKDQGWINEETFFSKKTN